MRISKVGLYPADTGALQQETCQEADCKSADKS